MIATTAMTVPTIVTGAGQSGASTSRHHGRPCRSTSTATSTPTKTRRRLIGRSRSGRCRRVIPVNPVRVTARRMIVAGCRWSRLVPRPPGTLPECAGASASTTGPSRTCSRVTSSTYSDAPHSDRAWAATRWSASADGFARSAVSTPRSASTGSGAPAPAACAGAVENRRRVVEPPGRGDGAIGQAGTCRRQRRLRSRQRCGQRERREIGDRRRRRDEIAFLLRSDAGGFVSDGIKPGTDIAAIASAASRIRVAPLDAVVNSSTGTGFEPRSARYSRNASSSRLAADRASCSSSRRSSSAVTEDSDGVPAPGWAADPAGRRRCAPPPPGRRPRPADSRPRRSGSGPQRRAARTRSRTPARPRSPSRCPRPAPGRRSSRPVR